MRIDRKTPAGAQAAPAPQKASSARRRAPGDGFETRRRSRPLALPAPNAAPGPSRPAMLQVFDKVRRGELERPAAPAAPRVDPRGRPVAPAPSALRGAFDALPAPAVRGDVRLLAENEDAWLAKWSALDRAEGPIDASYFIFERDLFGMAYLGKLLEKARDGVPVRLMLDAIGDAFGHNGFTKPGLGRDYLQELVETGGADVQIYFPAVKKLAESLKDGGRPFSAVANNHDKLLRTPDTVITGGRNISSAYFTSPDDGDGVYVDCDVQIRGGAASGAFVEAFEREWRQEGLHYAVKPDRFGNWVRRDLELLGAATMMDQWLATPTSPAEARRLRADPTARKAEAKRLVEETLAALPGRGVDRAPSWRERRSLNKSAKQLVEQVSLRGAGRGHHPDAAGHRAAELKVLDRTSAAVEAEDELGPGLAALAAGARKRILLHNPYVVLTESALAALEEAGERGVHIDLLTNSPDSTDSLLTQAFFLEDWPRILARVPNLRIFALTGDEKLHAKVATADDEISVVGSYNLDLISEKINGELAMVSAEPALARQIRGRHRQLLADPAQGVVEYTIARDARGQPVFESGRPKVDKGPEQHMSLVQRVKYAALRGLVRLARKLPALRDIRGIQLPARARSE